jgi:DNA-binding transcriptional ArsR family regulator
MRSLPSKFSKSGLLQTQATLIHAEDISHLSRFFAALADPTRLKLLVAINSAGRLGATECVKASGLSQGRTSVHLSCLAACGLIAVERVGRRKYYRIASTLVPEILCLSHVVVNENVATLAQCRTAQPTAS